MQRMLILGLVAATLSPLPGSTLQQLSLDDMIRLSTVVVHGKVQPTYSAYRGAIIYTHYQVLVSETLKGSARNQIEIVVPGGAANRLQQTFAGAPTLLPWHDYVLFLWTSKSGLTQVIGLSQGLFVVTTNATGQFVVTRPAATERMVDTLGRPVADSDIQMLLTDLCRRIQTVFAGGGAK